MAVEVVPSPKDQDALAGGGVDVLLKVIFTPAQTVSGEENEVMVLPIVTALGLIMVSLQPVVFVTINCTV